MKIAVLVPQTIFTKTQQKTLASLGEVIYTNTQKICKTDYLLKLIKGANVLAADPDNLGGFEKAKPVLMQLIKSLPNLKGVALSTTSYGWIDLDYCKKRNIPVTNIPGYSREAVAEHTLALLLAAAKNILLSEKRTMNGKYTLELGMELKGKTLGVIGIGNIGSRTAELARAIGMKVIAYNHSPKHIPGVVMKSLSEVLQESDAIVIHTTHRKENEHFISKKELKQMKNGSIVVNTADRSIIDETAMVAAVKSQKVKSYVFEAEDLESGPLAGLEQVFAIKGYGWYTKESIERCYQIWVDNIIAITKGKPKDVIKI